MDNVEIKMQLKSLVSNFKRPNIFFSRTQKFHDSSDNVQLWKQIDWSQIRPKSREKIMTANYS